MLWHKSQEIDFDSAASLKKSLKWILWGHFLMRSNTVVKQKEVRLCSGRSKFLILRKKDKVSLLWSLLPTLCQHLHSQDQLDFLFEGGNSCRAREFLGIQHKAPPQGGMYLLTPHRALMVAPPNPLENMKNPKEGWRTALKALLGHIRAARTYQNWGFWQEKHRVCHMWCFPGSRGSSCCLLPWDTWVFPAGAKGGNGGNH